MACRRLAWNLPRLLAAQSRVRRRRKNMQNSVLLENKCFPLNLVRCFTVKRLKGGVQKAERCACVRVRACVYIYVYEVCVNVYMYV